MVGVSQKLIQKRDNCVAKRRKRKRRPVHTIKTHVSGGHYQKGQICFQLADYAAAVKAWRAAMKAKPRGIGMQPPESDLARKLAEAHFRYALSMDGVRQITQIISELHQAIQRAPHVAIYHYHLGLAYHRRGHYEKAIAAYERALKLRPGDERFQRHLAFALAESDQAVADGTMRALQLLKQEKHAEVHNLLRQHPLGEIHGLFEGYACAMQGDYAEAKRQFNQCTAPEYAPLAAYYLGLIYTREGKFPSAIKNLETAMNARRLEAVCKPILLGVYKQQAVKYAEAGERDKANRLWNKIARLDPEDAAADNAVAVALQEGYRQASEGNLSQAMRSWRRLINQGVQHPALLQNYAIACDRTENYEAAMETWEQLAAVWEKQQRTAPDSALLKRKLALVYRRIGELAWHLDDLDEARDAYQKALRFTPEDLEIRSRLVGALLDEGDYDAAFRQLRQLRRQHPDDIRVLEVAVSAYLEVEDFPQALQSGLDILKLDPKHEQARELVHTLGCDQVRDLLQENRHRQAVRLLQRLLQADKAHLPFYLLLGEAYLEQDMEVEALDKGIEIAEDKALAYAQVGKTYMVTEYFEQAELHFEEAERLNTEHPDILLTIGIAYMPYDMRKANHYLDKLIAGQPDDSEVFEKITGEFIEAGKPDLAQKIVDRGLKAFPESLALLLHRIMIAVLMDNLSLARKMIKTARKLAISTEDFEVLQIISNLEMMLSFQTTFGDLFGDYEDFYEPF